MGKQINFYMSNNSQQEFIHFLTNQGFEFLKSGLLKNDILIQSSDVISEFKVYLHKNNFGRFIIEQIGDSTQKSISSLCNPVIEFRLSKTNTTRKCVTSGRLWLTSYDFLDIEANRELILTEYNRLVRWIKKNVLYQPAISSGKIYIDRESLELVKTQNYRLQ